MFQQQNNVSTSTFQTLAGVEKCKYVDKWIAKVSLWTYNLVPGTFFRCGLFMNIKWCELLYIDQKYKTWPEKWRHVLKRLWNMFGHDFFPSVWYQWLNFIDQHEAFIEHSQVEGLEIFFPHVCFNYEISKNQFNEIVVAECLWKTHCSLELSCHLYTSDFDFFLKFPDFPSRLKAFIIEKRELSSLVDPCLVQSVKNSLKKSLKN